MKPFTVGFLDKQNEILRWLYPHSYSYSYQQGFWISPATGRPGLIQAYLNRGEESPFISDLYLGGALQELTLLIRPSAQRSAGFSGATSIGTPSKARWNSKQEHKSYIWKPPLLFRKKDKTPTTPSSRGFLSLRGHHLEERWHGLTAPFMSFILRLERRAAYFFASDVFCVSFNVFFNVLFLFCLRKTRKCFVGLTEWRFSDWRHRTSTCRCFCWPCWGEVRRCLLVVRSFECSSWWYLRPWRPLWLKRDLPLNPQIRLNP